MIPAVPPPPFCPPAAPQTTALTQGLERIPDQLGYLVISDGAVLAVRGDGGDGGQWGQRGQRGQWGQWGQRGHYGDFVGIWECGDIMGTMGIWIPWGHHGDMGTSWGHHGDVLIWR